MNNLETYPIHIVEQLTGVKAHTLRIWEKRYQGLTPHRTATNIRYYDGQQLRRLLNIAALLKLGFKISHLMALSEAAIHELVSNTQLEQQDNGILSIPVNELIGHMLSFNEVAFEKVCAASIVRYGLFRTITQIIYPFLNKTGVLWSISNTTPAQEHFASNIIRRKLLSAIDGLITPYQLTHKAILFLPPDEWHEIGLLFADYILRTEGITTIYLGQNLPFNSLASAIETLEPSHIITFFTCFINKEHHLAALHRLKTQHPLLKIVVCANALPDKSDNQIAFLNNPDELLSHF